AAVVVPLGRLAQHRVRERGRIADTDAAVAEATVGTAELVLVRRIVQVHAERVRHVELDAPERVLRAGRLPEPDRADDRDARAARVVRGAARGRELDAAAHG